MRHAAQSTLPTHAQLPDEPARRARRRLVPTPRSRSLTLSALGAVAVSVLAFAVPQAAQAAVNHNPVGTLDSATVTATDGSVTLTGWAIDADAPKSSLRVEVRDNGAYKTAVIAKLARPDVGQAYPAYGADHGYSIRVPEASGVHTLCVLASNIGTGVSGPLGCKTVTVTNDPFGTVEANAAAPGGFVLSGFAIDPNTTSPVLVRTYVDGKYAAGAWANQARTDLKTRYPASGINHGFAVNTPVAGGSHLICAYALNLGAGTVNTKFRCVQVNRATAPVGSTAAIARVGASDAIAVSGWALDPDTGAAIRMHITSDGVDRANVAANLATPATPSGWAQYGGQHGYSTNVALNANEHVVCAVAYNVGAGVNSSQGCVRVLTSGAAAPAAPGSLTAVPGSNAITLRWSPATATNYPVTGYQVTTSPGGQVVTTSATATSATIGGLTNGSRYGFSVRALNVLGRSSESTTTATPTAIPPQLTPAPVSTSHYVRNMTGNLATDAAMMRTMGATDASYNPSGHSYLVLLQIGGQDEYDGGALLSATARYVSYPAVVSGVKAYLDGYSSAQKASAPLTLAVGTNNDVDVDASAGVSWARNIVNPIAGYAASMYPGTIIAGANDMEPGFSANVTDTRAWLSGYLGATTARFVFNGSADGCSTSNPGVQCNNGWSMADLQWLSGGAAPARTISLPQIYNYAMPMQWKNISLTGTNAGRPPVYFGGPLTEVTACTQAGSCGSISNVDAWNQLWAAISSTTATSQSQMPHGTDLRIN